MLLQMCMQYQSNVTYSKIFMIIRTSMTLLAVEGLNTQNIYDSDLHKLYLSKVIENNSKFIGVHFTELFIEIFNTWCMFHSRIKFSLLLTTKLYINTKKAQEASKNEMICLSSPYFIRKYTLGP